jgi:hypothetical protein
MTDRHDAVRSGANTLAAAGRSTRSRFWGSERMDGKAQAVVEGGPVVRTSLGDLA